MLTFAQAKNIAVQKIGPHCALMEEFTITKAYGWYFAYQSNDYLRTRDERYLLIGSGGFIVERANGNVFEFGSLFPTERNLAAYEYGLRYDGQDLLVPEVWDLKKSIDYLFRAVNHVAVAPGVAARAIFRQGSGSDYQPAIKYSPTQIGQMLHKAPCIFSDCAFFYRYEDLLAMADSRCCEFQICNTIASS